MRTITELYLLKGRVYVWFESVRAYEHFRRLAIAEGFSVPDDADIVSLQSGWRFIAAHWAGHMLFYNPSASKGEPLVRVDYTRWIVGAEDYIFHGDGK